MTFTQNLHIVSREPLPTPREIQELLPVPEDIAESVSKARRQISDIIAGRDSRFLLVVGPCSIHDSKAAIEYADRLSTLNSRVKDVIQIVMRVYFEKPRTSVGWKGFINDPFLDDSFQVGQGLKLARELLLEVSKRGLAIGTEALDPITPQYMDDLVSWSAIGARTVESQTHREMASGLSMPVGFKNGTDGNIEVAINALRSVSTPHRFLGINHDGRCCVFHTSGNPAAHIVLRGGGGEPNYYRDSIEQVSEAMAAANLTPSIMVDCSHGNSGKKAIRQPEVFRSVLESRKSGLKAVMGAMIESHLFHGSQPLGSDPGALRYGVSITDECIDWEMTEELVLEAAQVLFAK